QASAQLLRLAPQPCARGRHENVLGVEEHAGLPDQVRQRAIDPYEVARREPVQRSCGEYGVEWRVACHGFVPGGIAQVGTHPLEAPTSVSKRLAPDLEKEWVGVESDDASLWDPLQLCATARSRATRQIEDRPRFRAGDLSDHLQHDAKPLLATGDVPLLLIFPSTRPSLPVDRPRDCLLH